MKIAVSASGPTLESDVDPRFGRCAYFVIVDLSTMEHEAIENSSVAAAQGAGIATAQMIAGKGVEAVLTGNCGPNAYQALAAAGVKVVSGVTGTVRDAALAYRGGGLRASEQANVASHFGMGMKQGRGMGGGIGGGMGGGRAAVPPPAPPADAGSGLADLMVELKRELDGLREQVADINRRIEELHKNR
ncbi:MAG: NifB/NifX family molybdenum-iron cluster-binding protein [Dehalococcoidia bacterium]|nr:NifB/NifX family molybdenum-iron cluster-binding protein [Dehalococcoidia bacterium]